MDTVAKETIHVSGETEGVSMSFHCFELLLRMAQNLKLKNFFFWNFPYNSFGLKLTSGN